MDSSCSFFQQGYCGMFLATHRDHESHLYRGPTVTKLKQSYLANINLLFNPANITGNQLVKPYHRQIKLASWRKSG